MTYNKSGYISLSLRPNGEIVISTPTGCSERTIKKFIDSSRDSVRAQLARVNSRNNYANGEKIGRNHVLMIQNGVRTRIEINSSKTIVTLSSDDQTIRNRHISEAVAKTLKLEAKRYLPKRLRYFALKYDFSYDKLRLTYAKSRWGSCSSNGTISLNVALMKLPDDLLDYVLLHELNHTKHMNHGVDFWKDLELIIPDAKDRRNRLRPFSPYI